MYHHYFEAELLELRAEINYHPELLLILQAQTNMDIYIQICEISAYCGVVLDGNYTKQDILGVCKKCTDVLRGKRVGHVYVGGTGNGEGVVQ
jgi:mannose/fructose/N-acetylgalactosamine-specific phosphotransferase system component IIB